MPFGAQSLALGEYMEILHFVRCESFPEGVRLFGCIVDEGHAVICVVYPTNAPPIARRMTAMEARLVQQRYAHQQIELTEVAIIP